MNREQQTTTCELCGEPMPPGEEMFKFHGYSGQCPKPPKGDATPPATPEPPGTVRQGWRVEVSHFGESIVSIENRMLTGKPDIDADDEATIRHAALNLLGFIGSQPPAASGDVERLKDGIAFLRERASEARRFVPWRREAARGERATTDAEEREAARMAQQMTGRSHRQRSKSERAEAARRNESIADKHETEAARFDALADLLTELAGDRPTPGGTKSCSGPSRTTSAAPSASALLHELLTAWDTRDTALRALVQQWRDPEFWRMGGSAMDSLDCAEELDRLLHAED